MVQMVRDYGNQLNWNVGGLFLYDRFIHILVDTINKLGYKNPIKSVYGSVPCIMAGGISPRFDFKDDAIISIIDEYNNRGIDCILDFSNVFVEEKSFNDPRCNKILEHLDCNNIEGFENKIIVSDPRYVDFVRERFCDVDIVASYMKPVFEVGLGNDSADYYNSLFSKFDYITINPFKIEDIEFLKEIKNRDRVFFVVNSIDLPNDPLTQKVYSVNMIYSLKSMIGEDCSEELKVMSELYDLQKKSACQYPMLGTNMSESSIEDLLRLGFKNFSLQGVNGEISTFIRDLGYYVFVPYLFTRVSDAILYKITIDNQESV